MPDGDISSVLLTGAAGFIGYHVAEELIARGLRVVGVDNLTDYYPVALKRDRLARLSVHPQFSFHSVDVADHRALSETPGAREADIVIHLAAQAGVRYSIDHPFAYGHANLQGHLSVLELVRHHPRRPRLVYASSSSVYGANTRVPFSESDRVDHPVSLYAATKRSCELMSESYARLYDMQQIGLRFFTVYGPWGRPDMAYWTFTRDILEGRPVQVFNNGDMQRDFTFISDIVAGVLSVALSEPRQPAASPHRIYNIGNNRPVALGRFIEIIEAAADVKAIKVMKPMQPGDVHATFANIDALARDHGFAPTTSLEEGIPRFVEWYRAYARI